MTQTTPAPRIVEMRKGILAKNDRNAAGLRRRYGHAGVDVSNWVSAPGSGKTLLLERLLGLAVERGLRPAALVGDCATDNDARRLAAIGVPVRQIVTEGRCHLEADMVADNLSALVADGVDLDQIDLLVVENVGNLVCPTPFDLGEGVRVVLLSVTEGEDKPLKYPALFASSDVIVVTKVDLADAVDFDADAATEAIASVAPRRPVVWTSARTGAGVDELLDVLVTRAWAESPAEAEERT